jgi:regulatory protein
MSPVITKIAPQKKNSRRYSLMSGDEFIIGVADETLLEFNIHPGMHISEEMLTQVKEKENIVAVKEQAWRYLARREHSTKELRDKLLRKNLHLGIIKDIIEDLTEKDYLNDARFARQLMAEEINFKKNGPRLIKGNLLKKGIESGFIDELLADFYSEENQTDNCQYLARKKLKSLARMEPGKQKKSLADYLNRKGYTWEVISHILSELFEP